MQSVMLSPSDRKFHGATHKLIITYTDLVALGANATGVIELVPDTAKFASTTAPVGTQIALAKIHLVTAFDFSDASVNSLLIEIGLTGGDTDAFLAQTQLAADGSYITDYAAASVTSRAILVTADTIDALFTAAGGGSPTLAEATSGELHVYLEVTTPSPEMVGIVGALGT